ncbi:hypothetical protein O9929_15810 [Vibrio lentus]|nr:hypothetical protein [Vibrio lentus]
MKLSYRGSTERARANVARTPNLRLTTLEEVIVTANKNRATVIWKRSSSVAVITGSRSRKKGATGAYDAIKSEPGVSVSGSQMVDLGSFSSKHYDPVDDR